MKSRFRWVITGIFILNTAVCFAEGDLEPAERYNDESGQSTAEVYEIKNPDEEVGLVCSFSQHFGYDNNVYLSSLRKGDAFSETTFKLGLEKPFYLGFALWEDIKLKLTYNLYNLAYTEITDASVMDNSINLNIQNKLVERNILEFNYNFGKVDYIKYEPGTYNAHRSTLSFKRYFTKKFYGRTGYGYLTKKYDSRKARYGRGANSGSARKDDRHIAELELGYYLWQRTLLKIRGQYYFNNSNDLYYDYYDYNSSRVSLSAIHIFNERLFGLLTFSEQFKNYDHRTILNNSRAQKDELFTVNTALLYDFTPSTSVSLNVTYRANDSNEPRDEYTETISSVGFHYTF